MTNLLLDIISVIGCRAWVTGGDGWADSFLRMLAAVTTMWTAFPTFVDFGSRATVVLPRYSELVRRGGTWYRGNSGDAWLL